MGLSNPFEIVLVLTAVSLIALTSFGIIAPSLGIEVPAVPQFPSLPNLNAQGNQSAVYAFDETHDLVLDFGVAYNQYNKFHVEYSDFNPLKAVEVQSWYYSFLGSWIHYFQIMRYGSWSIIPWWYSEPISFMNGTDVPMVGLNPNSLNPQTIVDNWNGTSSSFIIDNGNSEYMAYVDFTALAGYDNLTSSWNDGHGFTARLYGNSYGAPSWTDQLVSYLSFFGAVISYVVRFIAYMVQVAATFFTILGLAGTVASGIIILIMIAFFGSILMYLRGGTNK